MNKEQRELVIKTLEEMLNLARTLDTVEMIPTACSAFMGATTLLEEARSRTANAI